MTDKLVRQVPRREAPWRARNTVASITVIALAAIVGYVLCLGIIFAEERIADLFVDEIKTIDCTSDGHEYADQDQYEIAQYACYLARVEVARFDLAKLRRRYFYNYDVGTGPTRALAVWSKGPNGKYSNIEIHGEYGTVNIDPDAEGGPRVKKAGSK